MKKGSSFQKELEKFSSDYVEEVREMLVLTEENVGGASSWNEGIWRPTVEILASVDLADGNLSEEKGQLCWLAQDKDRGGWIFDLKPLTVYRVKYRAIKAEKKKKDMPARFANCYLLLEVVERDVCNELLEKVLEEYKKPVFITDELCGKFELERAYNWFGAKLDWLGEECSVSLECDEEEDGVTANGALAAFREIYANLEEWDRKFRAFAAEELTELANEWQDNENDFGADEDEEFDDDEDEEFDEDEDEEFDDDEDEEFDEDGDEEFDDDEDEEFDEDEDQEFDGDEDEDFDNDDNDADSNESSDQDSDLEDGEGSGSITKESFAKRIHISEFSIDADGAYTAYYEDDDMFYGHVILIEGSLEDGMESADIAG